MLMEIQARCDDRCKYHLDRKGIFLSHATVPQTRKMFKLLLKRFTLCFFFLKVIHELYIEVFEHYEKINTYLIK